MQSILGDPRAGSFLTFARHLAQNTGPGEIRAQAATANPQARMNSPSTITKKELVNRIAEPSGLPTVVAKRFLEQSLAEQIA